MLALATALLLAAAGAAGSAQARPYTVYACDAAGFWGHASNAWTPLGIGTVARCPSFGNRDRGLTTRLVGAHYAGFTASLYDFFAPPGTSITGVRWSGRVGRNHCSWDARLTAFPFESTLVGMRAGEHCTSSGFDSFTSIFNLPTPPGTTHLRQMVVCAKTTCPPGATLHSRHLEVHLEDGWNPNVSVSGPLADGRWVSRDQIVRVNAEDNSGIRQVNGSVAGAGPALEEFVCNPTFAVPCPYSPSVDLKLETASLPDGLHTLTVKAVDAAGNTGSTSRTVRIDNTPPDPVAPSLQGGESWRTSNDFDLRWSNSASQHAPIAAAHWELCSEAHCVTGTRQEANIDSLENLAVERPGDHTLRVWLEDAAGNARKEAAIAAVHLRFDPEAPSLSFEPPDPSDPLRVAVLVSDRHSGPHNGEIEIRREGTTAWHGLDTRLADGRLVAYVDDQRFRKGSYEFRARAVDRAGNETSIGPRDAGGASLRLPVRATTRLKAGVPRVSVKRTVVRRHGRRLVVRRRVVSLDSRVRVKRNRLVALSGRLTNRDRQPLEDATVDVLDETEPGAARLLTTMQSARDGSLKYRFRARRNRVIRFHYRGSRRISPADATVRVSVPASSSIEVSRSTVLNGEAVFFRGRVLTRPVPAAGKLIEVQAHFRNRWRTFSTVRTDREGRWRFPYHFGGTIGRVRYRFRVWLPAEGGYPFVTGRSRVLRVLVIGL